MVAVPHMSFDIRRVGIKNYKKLVPAIKRNLMVSMKVFGNHAIRGIIKKMKVSKPDNSPPWKDAKGGGKVLFNTNHLSTQIKSQLIPGTGPIFMSIEVGWLENSTHPERQSSGGLQDIVKYLTSKQTWEPGRRSAKAFWAQVPQSFKSNNPPLFKETWTSPKRDFLQDTIRDPAMLALFHKYVTKAIDRAMKGK